jgi:putative zinc finger/helix-turn-helix YgiT family protein
MTKTIGCSLCNGVLSTKIGDFKTPFRDEKGNLRELTVHRVTWDECENCQEVFLDDAATNAIQQAQRKALGRLSPDAIRTWRESLEKSQSEMASLLGFGAKNFSRWENGAYIPNLAADRYIRLVMARPENLQILSLLAAGLPADDEHSISASASPAENQDSDKSSLDLLAKEEPLVKRDELFTAMMEQGCVFAPMYESIA